MLRNPRLRAEVLEHDPQRPIARGSGGFDVIVRKPAPERFDDDTQAFARQRRSVACCMPAHDVDLVHALPRLIADGWMQPRKGGYIVDEKANVDPVLRNQLARETPAHAHVAEVVDDAAEYVPTLGHTHDPTIAAAQTTDTT